MNFQNNMMSNPMSPQVLQNNIAPNPMNAIYNMFGGAQNFQQQVNQLQQKIPMGMTPEAYANQMVQTGQLSQERLKWAMQTVNSYYGRR